MQGQRKVERGNFLPGTFEYLGVAGKQNIAVIEKDLSQKTDPGAVAGDGRGNDGCAGVVFYVHDIRPLAIVEGVGRQLVPGEALETGVGPGSVQPLPRRP